VNILIVDDEALARERLARLLRDLGPAYRVVGEAGSGEQALALCASREVDLVLLDIRMPGLDGMGAAARLAGAERPPAVIFTTAYEQHALEAFEHNAVGYLLKPIRRDQLLAALERARVPTRPQLEALRRMSEGAVPVRSHVCAIYRGAARSVPIEDIRYFRAEEKYVVARHGGGELLLEESLKSLEQDFGTRLLRIHRNALVAKAYLSGLERDPEGRYRVLLRDLDETLEVSRRHLPALRSWFREVAT
jgi:two-component system response regulator AlgR